MFIETESETVQTTTAEYSTIRKSRKLKLGAGGVLGLSLIGFSVSFEFPGVKATIEGWLRSPSAPTTTVVTNLEPYPAVPVETAPGRPLQVPPNAAQLQWPDSVQPDFAEPERVMQWSPVHWENFAYIHEFIPQGDGRRKIQREWILCIGPIQPDICSKSPEYRLTHPIHNPDWH